MDFRTELSPSKLLNLDHQSRFFSIGSCFANMVGNKLLSNKFEVTNNPFGIIYNPLSIFELLQPNSDILDYMVENDGIWYNYKLHSDFRDSDKSKLKESIIEASSKSTQELHTSNVIIMTFGTAFVYRIIENNEVVTNCHKIPQKNFTKELLTVHEIVSGFQNSTLHKLNADIILTVSPVRHVKDTITLNSASKSTLRLACHQLQEMYSNVHYFPAYELMMDDLRDYRYYKDDLLHPTEFAENYIWEKFITSVFSETTLELLAEWNKIVAGLQHTPFNPTSVKHQQFLAKQLKKLNDLSQKINCQDEIEIIKSQLIDK